MCKTRKKLLTVSNISQLYGLSRHQVGYVAGLDTGPGSFEVGGNKLLVFDQPAVERVVAGVRQVQQKHEAAARADRRLNQESADQSALDNPATTDAERAKLLEGKVKVLALCDHMGVLTFEQGRSYFLHPSIALRFANEMIVELIEESN